MIVFAIFRGVTGYQEHTVKKVEIKQNIVNIEKKIVKAKEKSKELQSYFTDIENAKKRIELVAAKVEEIQKRLPNEISDTENLGLLKDIGAGVKLKDLYLTPQEEINNGFYIAKTYEVRGEGTYLQFLLFLEKIAENKMILNIREVSLERGKKNQRGRFLVIQFKTVVEAYRYNPDYKEDSGIQKMEEGIKNDNGVKNKKKG